MEPIRRTRWLRARIACAAGVLVLLVVELTGHRNLPIEVVQLTLTGGIVVTSVLDLVELRRRRQGATDYPR
jgi:hypothetical protein